MILVTKPFLPPISEYEALLQQVWDRGWLTNNGPLVLELESRLKEFLSIRNLLYVTNGTIAIQIAIKALGLKGKIITTPFSYVATTSSIVWEGCEPIFVDIDPKNCNIDPAKIEEAVTEDTVAILATHVYGIPCDVDRIKKIAERHNLKVLYDGAHAFGVKLLGKSIFEFGDVSTCSLHATKLYHSVEGGLIVAKDKALHTSIDFHRNFGHNGPGVFTTLGINGKNSEVHAAMGIVNLNYVVDNIEERKHLCEFYDAELKSVPAHKPIIGDGVSWNYGYYPIIFNAESILVEAQKRLNERQIFPRRYFHPTLQELPYIKTKANCKIATDISSRILCLPLYNGLT
ncbi:MAG: DegT/DnrJ/EryC1/StrS family aminotransferase, partial [Flammeovirgaceae bacterium]